MRLIYDWKVVLMRAWSVRLMALFGLMELLDVALPLFNDAFLFPAFPYAVAKTVVAGGAIAARFIDQRNIPG